MHGSLCTLYMFNIFKSKLLFLYTPPKKDFNRWMLLSWWIRVLLNKNILPARKVTWLIMQIGSISCHKIATWPVSFIRKPHYSWSSHGIYAPFGQLCHGYIIASTNQGQESFILPCIMYWYVSLLYTPVYHAPIVNTIMSGRHFGVFSLLLGICATFCISFFFVFLFGSTQR